MASQTCPSPSRLKACAESALSSADGQEVRAHADGCAGCRRELELLNNEVENTATLNLRPPAALFGEGPRSSVLARGEPIGRYLVLEQLGEGGMGVVYAAYDPQLHRRVALKLVRSERDGASSSSGATRLLREAQALAQLSHPNVVSIYDVGAIDEGGVFLAIELVDGQSLRQWLDAGPRPWRDVLRVFLAAGRGLAAAHAAGLVHRDFKPDNVLLRKDGHVFVTDFGLARAATHPPLEPGGEDAELSASGTALAMHVTRAGAVVGTAPYLAPELIDGAPADPRSDQFAFCVALHEALYGKRPFSSRAPTREERWRLEEPSGQVAVPARVRRLVLRGLSLDPQQRHPSMQALLEAITRESSDQRRRWALGGAAAVAALTVGIVAARGRAAPLCSGAAARLSGVWDATTRASVGEAFALTKHPRARELAEGASNVLDEYARSWAAAHQDACEATRVRGEQSDEVLSLRMACLEQRRGELGALVEVLTHADTALVRDASGTVRKLTPLSSCQDLAVLRARVKPPKDAATAQKVEALRARAAKPWALLVAGKYKEALPLAQALVEEARPLEYRALDAELLQTTAQLQERSMDSAAAEQSALAGVAAALASGRADVAAKLYTELVYMSVQLGKLDQGQVWIDHAQAEIEALGGDPQLEATLQSMIGSYELNRGRFPQAVEAHRRSLELMRRMGNTTSVEVGAENNNLAHALYRAGDPEAALRAFAVGTEIYSRVLDPEHPRIATNLYNMGDVLGGVGRREEAIAAFRRAIEIRVKAFGRKSTPVATAQTSLAQELNAQGDYEAALALLQEAKETLEETLGPEAKSTATTLNQLGGVLSRLGRHQEGLAAVQRAVEIYTKTRGPEHTDTALALAYYAEGLHLAGRMREAIATSERVLAIWEKNHGPKHPRVADALSQLADYALEAGRPEESRRHCERALEILIAANGPDSPILSPSLSALGKAHLALHQPARALEPLERALRLLDEKGTAPDARADLRFALARALEAAHRDRARALALAQEALGELKRPTDAKKRAEVERWLAERR